VWNSSFAGIFFIFWFQDEVGSNGFSLLGRHITDAPQTALAFTSTISQITGFVLTGPGGWIADKFPYNRAQLLFVSALVQTLCPIANAFRPDFTWVCATTLFSGLTGGLTSTCGRSITADCVPVDPVTQVPLALFPLPLIFSYKSEKSLCGRHTGATGTSSRLHGRLVCQHLTAACPPCYTWRGVFNVRKS
jgi:MFS family permease